MKGGEVERDGEEVEEDRKEVEEEREEMKEFLERYFSPLDLAESQKDSWIRQKYVNFLWGANSSPTPPLR